MSNLTRQPSFISATQAGINSSGSLAREQARRTNSESLPNGIPQQQIQMQRVTSRQNFNEPPTPAPLHTSDSDKELDNSSPNSHSNHRTPVAVHLLHTLSHSSLVLENSGSVARDHLASERTFLAYMRTSLAIAGMGVALVQLFAITAAKNLSSEAEAVELFGLGATVQRFSRPLGTTTVFLGLCVLALGIYRYFKIQHAMLQGLFPAARGGLVLLTAALAALVTVTFGILATLPL
ncbi:hypothetical protein K439DRAFT_1637729 [Ramaria rubella]|nr:hypothetical protein K439DRAFT_1640348 [Ramaria rubella]KAF8579706.1 hypothetical protein K439DRAFT_1637729 [Ramaria rubella]